MIFLPGAALQQQPALWIDETDRNRPMQQALSMRGQFRRATYVAVLGIDQDHLFRIVVHYPSPLGLMHA